MYWVIVTHPSLCLPPLLSSSTTMMDIILRRKKPRVQLYRSISRRRWRMLLLPIFIMRISVIIIAATWYLHRPYQSFQPCYHAIIWTINRAYQRFFFPLLEPYHRPPRSCLQTTVSLQTISILWICRIWIRFLPLFLWIFLAVHPWMEDNQEYNLMKYIALGVWTNLLGIYFDGGYGGLQCKVWVLRMRMTSRFLAFFSIDNFQIAMPSADMKKSISLVIIEMIKLEKSMIMTYLSFDTLSLLVQYDNKVWVMTIILYLGNTWKGI